MDEDGESGRVKRKEKGRRWKSGRRRGRWTSGRRKRNSDEKGERADGRGGVSGSGQRWRKVEEWTRKE